MSTYNLSRDGVLDELETDIKRVLYAFHTAHFEDIKEQVIDV